jgi:hypothetical protein
MAKIIGVGSEQLESVKWKKPGVLDVVVSKIFLTRDGPGKVTVDASKVWRGPLGRLVGISYENHDVYSKKIVSYRAAAAVGGAGGSGPYTQGGGGVDETLSLSVVMDQVDLARHRNISTILSAGGGVLIDGKIVWPSHIMGGNGEMIRNPWFGVQSFFCPRVEVSIERYAKVNKNNNDVISASELDGLGWFDGGPVDVGVNWVLTGRSVLKTKNQQITKTTWQGSKHGFPEPVYTM